MRTRWLGRGSPAESREGVFRGARDARVCFPAQGPRKSIVPSSDGAAGGTESWKPWPVWSPGPGS